jgi:hypothetical protein
MIPIKSTLGKNVWHGPKSHDLFNRGRWTQTFFSIFHTFTKGVTDHSLPFVKNVKN